MTSVSPPSTLLHPPSPEPPRARGRLFYGWYIVAVAFLAQAALAFTISSTLGIFLKPITADLGVSRSLFSLLRAAEVLIQAPLTPIIGPLLDRHGARWILAGGAIVTGTGLVLSGIVTGFWQFAAVRVFVVGIGAVLAGHMVVNVAVSNWFSRRRGQAIGVGTFGHGMSKLAMPVATTFLIAAVGWRSTWVVYGLIYVTMVLGPALLWVRRRPEDMGLQADGDPDLAPADRAARASRDGHEHVWTRSEVLRSPTTWLIVATFGVSHIGIMGLNLHLYAYLTDRGFSDAVAALGMAVIAFCQGAFAIVWGMAADRVGARLAAMGKFLAQFLGLAITILSNEPVGLVFGLFLYGVGMGGFILQDVLWAECFGRRSLGTARGVGMPFTIMFAAGGPVFFGALFDLTGSYDGSFLAFMGALVAAAILVSRIPSQPSGTVDRTEPAARG